MRKILLILTVLFAVAVVTQSCGASRGNTSRGNKNGVGCPSGNPNKPFRA